MAYNQRTQTPFERPTMNSARIRPVSSLLESRATSRSIFSTPEPRRARQGPSRSLPSGPSRTSSRASSMTSTHSQISRETRSRTGRQRASMRSSGIRSSSSHPIQEPAGDEELEDHMSSEEADALNEVIMAIDMKENGSLGCAYYIAADETLYLLEDVAMGGIDLVDTLLLHAKPTSVLIPARAPDSLAEYLERGAQGVEGNRGDLPGAHVLRNLNSADFRYESGRDKLLSLDLETSGRPSMLYESAVDDEMDGAADDDLKGSRQAQLVRLGTLINLDSHMTIGCAGAVLGDLQRRRTAQYLPNDPDALVAFSVRTVEMFALFNSMFVNADTLVSLQILQSEDHPNSHHGPNSSTSGSKESLSVYGLFQHLACTPQGRVQLRRIFLRPSIDIDLINERQKTITFFLHPGNDGHLTELTKGMRKIKNMRTPISLLQQGVDNPGRKVSVANSVWASLQRFARFSLRVRELLRAMPGADNIVVIRKATEIIEPLQICQVGELITQTIDFEQSVERGRTAVKQGVDPALDKLKRSYDGMEHFLTGVIAKLRSEIPEWAKNYVQNCLFFPQLGFLTSVSLNPETGKGNYDGEGLDDVWERMFAAEGFVYYKNQRMKEMDEQFGDAYCMIIDREIEIIHELTVRVLERRDAIIAASESSFHWVAPVMTNDNVIHIEGGRHPLQELVVPAFISNDCHMAGGSGDPDEDIQSDLESSVSVSRHSSTSPSTLILTGPNHSGKSVYLKQVALTVYLAHIGSFVPAERARIGITDRILTRIATRESVARNESAFSIDLRQVAFAMNFATRRSLVLVDEFGKGTNTTDGAGLVAALLAHFTSLGPTRPKVLAASHFHEIFENRFLEESPELAFGHMDIRVDYDAPTMEDQVTYLYKLVPGRSISSFGSRCAAMNGIDEAIVDRAEAIMLLIIQNEDLEVACTQLSDPEVRQLEKAEAVARASLQVDMTPPSKSSSASKAPPNWHRSLLERILSVDSTDAPVPDDD